MDVPSFPSMPSMDSQSGGPLAPITNFIKQSQRVLNVTHKPGPFEYKQIAYITGIGMLLIGAIGFVLSMVFHFANGSL